MLENIEKIPLAKLTDSRFYNITNLETEILADQYCQSLLKHFHHWLLQSRQYAPLKAGQLAAGADYFLREFLIGSRRMNIFCITPRHIRQFGGNWYIVQNLEPNMVELKPMLDGAAHFYHYCAELEIMPSQLATDIKREAGEIDYYRQRIEDFHALTDNGYHAWEQACTLKR